MADKKKSKEEKNVEDVKASEPAAVGFALPLNRRIPDGMQGLYSNHLIVQFGPTECTLAFFEIKAPIVLGTPEEQAEQAKNLSSIPADCVARIVLAPAFVPQVIAILQDTWQKHSAMISTDPEMMKTPIAASRALTVNK
jgi:hypothetical protein